MTSSAILINGSSDSGENFLANKNGWGRFLLLLLTRAGESKRSDFRSPGLNPGPSSSTAETLTDEGSGPSNSSSPYLGLILLRPNISSRPTSLALYVRGWPW
ncbi:small G protein family protein / RhoGAP family protein [Striga asiatica]|uniref:Small G protein family protein / RhoGAP family protein n=1 Tax=Striga asiatica TaxID=4170 RepID=A0A5A7R1X3_STRAF|nr:small G protein family protein / RhoGAP family protein [Striga asiatica]